MTNSNEIAVLKKSKWFPIRIFCIFLKTFKIFVYLYLHNTMCTEKKYNHYKMSKMYKISLFKSINYI